MRNLFCNFLVCVLLTGGSAAAQKAQPSTKSDKKMKIELLYFSSCPSYKQALANINAALKEKKLRADVVLINVTSEAKAQQVGFQGSPSVRINGKDIEGRDEGFTFSCRIYNNNGKPAVAPSKEAIIAKIESLMKSTTAP